MRIRPIWRARVLVTAASLVLALPAVLAAAVPAAGAAVADPARSASGSGGPAALSAESALAQARKSGLPVVAGALTSPTSQTIADPDGRLTVTESVMPVRAWHDGRWQPFSATLVKTAGGRLSPQLAAAPLSLSDGGTGALAVLIANARTLTLTWPGALPAPVVSGATATYAGVLPGVDLEVTATSLGGVAETLVVRGAAAAANPALATLRLGVHASGLTVTLSRAGQLSAAAGPGARPLITTPPVQMWDSAPPPAGLATATGPGGVTVMAGSGLPADSSAAAPGAGARLTTVPVSLSGGTLTLSPPAAALTGAGVTYPVYIDPTYDNAAGSQATDWTQVDSGFATTSYWGETSDLQVGDCYYTSEVDDCNGLGVARTFFQLPLGSQLVGADIGSADIYMDDQWAADGCTAQPADLYTTGSISSATTWDNQPGWGTEVEQESFAFGGGGSCGYYAADVAWGTGSAATGGTSSTELAAIIASDVDRASPYTSQTFGLRADNESQNLQWKQFASGAANITMTITYDQPPAAPASLQIAQAAPAGCQATQATAAVIGDDDVTFTADTTDPHTTDSMTTTLDIYNPNGTLADMPGGDPVPMTNTTDGSGIAYASLTASQMQALTTGGATQAYTYYWQAQTTNAYGHVGPWSTPCWFTYNPVGPAAPTLAITLPGGTATTTVPYASAFNVAISPPAGCGGSADPCPASYTYQLGAAAPGTLNAASGTVQLTMNQVGPVDVTVTSFADGNPGTPVTSQIQGTAPATSYDGYFAGGSYPSLLTLTGAATATPALLLSPGTGNGTLAPADDIGSLGNGTNAGDDSPADWTGDIIAHGNFLPYLNGGSQTTDVQDLLFYNPSSTAGGIIPGTDSTATLTGTPADIPAISGGQLANDNGDNPAQPNASGVTPASQLVGAGNASGIGTGADDLIGIAGNATSHDFELDIYTNGLCAGCAAGSSYGYTATLSITSPDTTSWGDYSLATVQAGSYPAGTPDPASVTLLALDTTNGHLYQTQLQPLSDTTGTWTEPALTWNQVTTPWGTTPPVLASADISNAGHTELWTTAGTTATAYTLSGSPTDGTLTADTSTSPLTPGHDWPLTDGQLAAQNGTTPPATAADLTGSDTATLHGAASWTADPTFGGTLTLNGSSYLASQTAAFTPDSSFTISAWVNPSILGGTVFSQSGTDYSSVEVSSRPNGQWSVSMNTGGTTSDTYASMPGGTVQLGVWTKLTLTYDTTSNLDLLDLYANGVEVASLYDDNPPAAAGPFVLGASQTGASSYASYSNGQLADVEVWDSLIVTPSTVTGITGAPATFDPLTGDQQLYASYTNSTAFQDSWSSASGWSGFKNISGYIASNSAALYDPASGNIEVYAEAKGGTAEEDVRGSSGAWSGWESLNGTLASAPAAVYDPATRTVSVVGVGTTDYMYVDTWPTAGTWSGWEDIGVPSGTTFSGTPSALYDPISGNLEVYAKGANGATYEDYRGSGSWSGWVNLGGDITSGPVTVYNPAGNSIQVFGIGAKGAVYVNSWTRAGGWTSWVDVGGDVVSAPAAVYNPFAATMQVFGVGTTGSMYVSSSTPSGWSGWVDLGGDFSQAAVPAYDPASGNLEVYALGSAGTFIASWNPTDDAYSAWTNIGPAFNNL